MEELSKILTDATEHVASEYFLVPIDGGNPVQRERVYCYELYHQMRCRWANDDFVLNGELDKGGHPKLKQMLGALKPDFLVHRPGSMGGNYAVIEVKPAIPSKKALRKDVKSIARLIREAKYQRGIYLIYGGANDDQLRERVSLAIGECAPGTPIELWHHPWAGAPAAVIASFG